MRTRPEPDWAQARADGTYLTVLRRLAKTQLLVLDDFGLEPLGAAERKELLEILEDRYNVTATLVTSQLDPPDWHAVIGDATVADAICDRLVHSAHRLTLRDESLRKAQADLTSTEKSEDITPPSRRCAPGDRLARNGRSACAGISDRLGRYTQLTAGSLTPGRIAPACMVSRHGTRAERQSDLADSGPWGDCIAPEK